LGRIPDENTLVGVRVLAANIGIGASSNDLLQGPQEAAGAYVVVAGSTISSGLLGVVAASVTVAATASSDFSGLAPGCNTVSLGDVTCDHRIGGVAVVARALGLREIVVTLVTLIPCLRGVRATRIAVAATASSDLSGLVPRSSAVGLRNVARDHGICSVTVVARTKRLWSVVVTEIAVSSRLERKVATSLAVAAATSSDISRLVPGSSAVRFGRVTGNHGVGSVPKIT